MKKLFTRLLLLVSTLFLAWVIQGFTVKPSLTREWATDQTVIPRISFIGQNRVTIKNIRNISYRSQTDFDVRHYDKTYDLDKISSAWFIVEPFGKFGAAHTLMSFGFSNGDYVAISAEIRKEVGEKFSPIKGILRQYEMMYVIADERDVIRLRTNFRKDTMRLYPIRTTKQMMRVVFVDALKRAERLATQPEFYNTLSNNCTTNIARHVRRYSGKAVPWWDYRYLLPSTVDAISYDLGLIDTQLSLDEARVHFMITDRAQKITDLGNFSTLIRDF